MNRKSRTLFKFALHRDEAMMALYDLLGHGQANAQTACLTSAAGICAPKTTEYPRKIIFCDANTRI